MPLDATGVARTVALADAGYSQRRIIRTLGVPRKTVRDAIRRFRETGSYTRRPGQGRHRCTSTRDDRFVVSNVFRNRFCTATEARTRLFEVRNVSMSERTIRRRMAERNLRPFVQLAPHNCSHNTVELDLFLRENMLTRLWRN